jgi:Ca2+-binding RTX toxin-like protein
MHSVTRRFELGSSSAAVAVAVESLEPRQHFAATLSPQALEGGWTYEITGNGTLLIQGSPDANEIVVSKNKTTISLLGDGRPESYAAVVSYFGINRIVIEGGGGNDTITTGGYDFVKPVYVIGGNGNDTIVGGPGQHLSGDAGNDHITAGVAPPPRPLLPWENVLIIGDSAGDRPSVVFAGDGDDTVMAGTGSDTVSGGGGTDLLLIKIGPANPIDLDRPIHNGSVDAVELVDRAPLPDNPPPFRLVFEDARERARNAARFGANVISGWAATMADGNDGRSHALFG